MTIAHIGGHRCSPPKKQRALTYITLRGANAEHARQKKAPRIQFLSKILVTCKPLVFLLAVTTSSKRLQVWCMAHEVAGSLLL